MNFEQCQAILAEIRRRQGTEHPMVEVSHRGSIARGRITRADIDRPRRNPSSPYGVLVLEQPGLVPGPLTFIQIADIPEDGLREIQPREHAKTGCLVSVE